MPNVKKFCSITKYLETIDKEFHGVLDDLCLFGLFRSRGSGITFLYPTDKTYRKKITTLAYGNTPEKAVDMIKVLVLSDYLPKPSDFNNKKDNIGNMLRKKLEPFNVVKDVVELKGGLKLKLDDKFIALNSDNSMIVYSMSGKGELSMTTEPASVKYTQHKPKHGGSSDNATDLAKWVEDQYLKQITDSEKKTVAYQATLAYTYFRATQMGERSVDICKELVKGMSAGARSTFYTTFNPYCKFGLCDLPTDFISQCSEIKRDVASCFSSYPDFYQRYRDEVLKLAGAGESDEDAQKRFNEQKKVIDDNTNTIVYKVKKKYEGIKAELARDLFSVYSYLSLASELAEPQQYNKCFLWIVRNVYVSINDITEHAVDLAHNMSIYGNLVRCDAYKYCPTSLTTKTKRPVFQDFNKTLPDPTSQIMFTIEHNTDTMKHGGAMGGRSTEQLNTMMSGGLE
jgi:hypothetical protein